MIFTDLITEEYLSSPARVDMSWNRREINGYVIDTEPTKTASWAVHKGMGFLINQINGSELLTINI